MILATGAYALSVSRMRPKLCMVHAPVNLSGQDQSAQYTWALAHPNVSVVVDLMTHTAITV